MSEYTGELADVPDGWVIWEEDGQIFVEEDAGGSPGSWPVEDS